MNPHEFETGLKAEHYSEITTVDRAGGYALGEHQHPFDACALITAGDITLVVDGTARNYAVGDIFRLPAGIVHLESAGPAGVSYLVGRRRVAAA
jgi:quercetin dioxygenase-like cupin family protein